MHWHRLYFFLLKKKKMKVKQRVKTAIFGVMNKPNMKKFCVFKKNTVKLQVISKNFEVMQWYESNTYVS